MFRTQKPLFFSVFLIWGVIFLAPGSFAAGQTTVTPYIDTTFAIDSNFHKAEGGERTVHTYSTNPGIAFGYAADKTHLNFDYGVDIIRYDDQDTVPAGERKASDFDFESHKATLTSSSQVTDKIRLGLDGFYWVTQDPSSADAFSNGVDRFEYDLSSISPTLLVKFAKKFGAGLGYSYQNTDFKDDDLGFGEDDTEHRGIFDLWYYMDAATSFDLNYQYWQKDYDSVTSDYDSQQVMLKVNHQLKFLTFSGGFGYHDRQFEKTTHEDFGGVVWQASVAGQKPEGQGLPPKYSVFIGVGQDYNSAGSGESYFTATHMNAVLTYLLYDRLNLTFDGNYQNSDYESGAREDDAWDISLAADWLANKYVTIGVKGAYAERDSNTTGKNFSNEYAMVHIKLNTDIVSTK